MKQTKFTPRQVEYLKKLADGPMTARDIADSMNRTLSSTNRVITKARRAGVIKSTKIDGNPNEFVHELIVPLDEIEPDETRVPVSEEEIRYVAELRNAGLTGKQLVEKFQTRFPTRPESSVLSIVLIKARKRKLCR